MPPSPVSRTYTNRSTSSRILSTLLTDTLLCDVTIITSSKSFPCHRAILAANSPVFSAMFHSAMQESTTATVTLEQVPAQVFAAARQYMYGNPFHVTEPLAIPASTFIRSFQIALPELADFLDALLTSALTLHNVLPIRAHADMHHAHRLRRNCDRFLTARMSLLPESHPFLVSQFPDAEAALRAPTKVSKTAAGPKIAQHTLAAAVAWLLHDEPAREQHTEPLLNAVDVDALSLPALVRASRDPVAAKSPSFQTRLLRAFARKAERDLGFAPLPGAGFAVVDEPVPARYGPEVPLFPYPAARATYHVRRRATLGAGSLVHPRLSHRHSRGVEGQTQTESGQASQEEEER